MPDTHTQHEKVLEKKLKQKQEELEEQKEKLKEQKDVSKTLEHRLKKEVSQFKKEFAERTLKLVTSGFGLVSALAWNEVIKETVNIYIKPYFGESSGIISLIIYAVIVTALAVFVTYQLGKIAKEK